jgi:hypothetical protein
VEDRPIARGLVTDHHYHPAAPDDAPHVTKVTGT